jgi:hypothetical protein
MEYDSKGVIVVCCGYRHIVSAKTSLTFPAWMVRLPCEQQDGIYHYKYWWRSKRDFMRLGRLVTRECSSIQPPKAALQKLASTAPWSRPLILLDCPRLPHNRNLNNQYHISMKKSLCQLDNYLNAIHDCARKDPSSPLAKQWSEFCRMQDVTELNHSAQTTDESMSIIPTTTVQESSRLGQYFCSRENAKQLVMLVLDWIDSRQQTALPHVTFVEPSCGQGQVVWTLLDELQKLPSISYTIIAWDIDSHAIQYCHQHDLKHQVQWRHGDFLTSTSSCACVDHHGATNVICLGGPPYTTGAGSDTIQRDLPERFVSHCLDEWKALFVAFFLPRRYEGHAWDYRPVYTFELDSSTFFFHGKAVPQPSILQCFTRSEYDSSSREHKLNR